MRNIFLRKSCRIWYRSMVTESWYMFFSISYFVYLILFYFFFIFLCFYFILFQFFLLVFFLIFLKAFFSYVHFFFSLHFLAFFEMISNENHVVENWHSAYSKPWWPRNDIRMQQQYFRLNDAKNLHILRVSHERP